jgi:hypothetical protein
VPVNDTVCGDEAALSVMDNVAEYVATAGGLNARYTLQVAAGASVAPQPFNPTKAEGLVPVSAIELKLMVAVPVLVRVTVTAADVVPCRVTGNGILVMPNFKVGAALPVPVSVTLCGEPTALSVKFSVAESAAAESGLKATNIWHDDPAASELPQVPISRNEVGLVPPSAIELMVSAAVPEFWRLTT